MTVPGSGRPSSMSVMSTGPSEGRAPRQRKVMACFESRKRTSSSQPELRMTCRADATPSSSTWPDATCDRIVCACSIGAALVSHQAIGASSSASFGSTKATEAPALSLRRALARAGQVHTRAHCDWVRKTCAAKLIVALIKRIASQVLPSQIAAAKGERIVIGSLPGRPAGWADVVASALHGIPLKGAVFNARYRQQQSTERRRKENARLVNTRFLAPARSVRDF